ncbi:hypothetical protein CEXT_222641 [Caerostris extrusa]|uniref:Uncharacterized protein n=1 Tax=Caerostris extrusa TaxID=172846 RepID=A0AAV4VH99_CAEEX|nr:hypothetical protein CEXT_222641 [Caerostris extrusa]
MSNFNVNPWCPLKIFKLAEGLHLDLVSDVNKKSSLESELKFTALDVSLIFLTPCLYYGSAEGAIRNAGARVHSIDFTLSDAIGRHFDNFDVEIELNFFGLRQNRAMCSYSLLLIQNR